MTAKSQIPAPMTALEKAVGDPITAEHSTVMWPNGWKTQCLKLLPPEKFGEKFAKVDVLMFFSHEMDVFDPDLFSSRLKHVRISYVIRDNASGVAAEWMPPDGPIMIWNRYREGIEKEHEEGVMYEKAPNFAGFHIFPEGVLHRPLNWSQLAVERESLPEAAADADIWWIFSVLRQWCRR